MQWACLWVCAETMFREAIHPEKGIVSSINADEKLQKENEYSKKVHKEMQKGKEKYRKKVG